MTAYVSPKADSVQTITQNMAKAGRCGYLESW